MLPFKFARYFVTYPSTKTYITYISYFFFLLLFINFFEILCLYGMICLVKE